MRAKDTTHVRSALRRWYRANAKPYPWRTEDASPYTILVAEFMLQQTQAPRVAQLLPPFLERYPTVAALADATNAQVVTAWKGLGYNSRALRLRDAARIIVDQHGGVVPSAPQALRQMPGIGPYASHSIPCFAYNVRTVVIDVNVRRVYSRWSGARRHTADLATPAEIAAYAQHIVPRQNAAEWHHAVMDLGSTICKARVANCAACPLNTVCPSAGLPQAPFVKKNTTEPLLLGEPRRVWRGRIVQRLREAGGRGLAVSHLLPKGVLASEEAAEWRELLKRMEVEGLISVGRWVRLRDV
jgi:A/G-specific adenine glycosylase